MYHASSPPHPTTQPLANVLLCCFFSVCLCESVSVCVRVCACVFFQPPAACKHRQQEVIPPCGVITAGGGG